MLAPAYMTLAASNKAHLKKERLHRSKYSIPTRLASHMCNVCAVWADGLDDLLV